MATHKKAEMPEDQELYMPVLVGAYKNHCDGIDYQRDDEDINISKKNPNYNELTAIYWAWKNLDDADVIGLVHYRRLFAVDKNTWVDKQLVDEKLKHYDVILPKERNYYVETNYSHYVHAHHEEPLIMTRRIIEKYHKDYLIAFDEVMNDRKAHMFNMFIMKRPFFESYCEWLFSVLEMLEINICVDDYSEQEARVFGYISELLMDVWVKTNHVNYCEQDWQQVGSKKVFQKGMHLVLRKFGLSHKTHF